jgi:AAA+ superfamily predicted ATPase
MNIFKLGRRDDRDDEAREAGVIDNAVTQMASPNGKQSGPTAVSALFSELPSAPPDIPQTPYTDSQAHVWDELLRIDQLVRAQTIRWHMTIAASKPDHLWGMLHVTDDEVAAFVQAPFNPADQLPDALADALQPYWQTAVSLAEAIHHRQELTDIPLRLDLLQSRFGLSDFEIDVLLVCLLSEIDGRYRRLFGYLQDDVSRSRPTVDLILQILYPVMPITGDGRAAFGHSSPLRRHHLLTTVDNGHAPEPLAMKTAQIDPRIADYLLGQDGVDGRLADFVTFPTPLGWQALLVPDARLAQLQALADWLPRLAAGGTLLLHGPYGSGRLKTAVVLCTHNRIPLLVVDVDKVLRAGADWELIVDLCYREATLRQAAVFWVGGDILRETESLAAQWGYLVETAVRQPTITFLSCTHAWEPTGAVRSASTPFLQLDCPIPSYATRCRLWEAQLPIVLPQTSPVELQTTARLLANSFQFTEGQIADAVASARSIATCRRPDTVQVAMEDLLAGSRRQSSQQIVTMARRIEPRPELTLDDIVLPAASRHQLQELLIRVQLRSQVYSELGFERRLNLGKGLIALFAGNSGTGKTMAAELLANEQGVDLYKVDLAAVVSKYVGETEKNLSRVFREAEGTNAIIIFDEADALFGKRGEVKEARDRWANMEVNFLLQRIEEYAGVVILTSNLRQNIDEAFSRRIHVVIEFPFPDVEARYRILRGLFPDEIQHPDDAELHELAARFELAGGDLKNVVLDAAFRALAEDPHQLPVHVTQRHMIAGISREYQKLGKPLVKGEFGDRFYEWARQDVLHNESWP